MRYLIEISIIIILNIVCGVLAGYHLEEIVIGTAGSTYVVFPSFVTPEFYTWKYMYNWWRGTDLA